MWEFTPKRRENMTKSLLALLAVNLASNVFSAKGLFFIIMGCIIGFIAFITYEPKKGGSPKKE